MILLPFFSSCEGKESIVVDTVGFPPRLVSAEINPSIVNSDTINIASEQSPSDLLRHKILVSATITHPLGEDQINPPAFSFFRTKSGPELLSGFLRDDGLVPDVAANDSIFTGSLEFSAERSEIGTFFVEITSHDAQGFVSNSIRLPFLLYRTNRPPVLSNLVAPDTIYLSAQDSSFLISVQASDPDGLSDIVSVTRTTSANNVYSLNDKGENGDAVSGDGVFTETVSLVPSPPPGSYEFRFKALDRSNTPSQIIFKTIVIAP